MILVQASSDNVQHFVFVFVQTVADRVIGRKTILVSVYLVLVGGTVIENCWGTRVHFDFKFHFVVGRSLLCKFNILLNDGWSGESTER